MRTPTRSLSSKAIQMWESKFNLAEACYKLTQIIKLEEFNITQICKRGLR
jgi:hypothetical protein